jgi:hypothetical protein
MKFRTMLSAAVCAVLTSFPVVDAVYAQGTATFSTVEQNSNVIGTTPPGFYRGIPAMQDNEASCAFNPILVRNIVCAWNANGGADDVIGDTHTRFSESIDGGETFINRYIKGSNIDPATSIGQQFMADPIVLCWPGGCGTVVIAATRAPTGGGTGGGVYMQWMVDLNTEAGFRKAFKPTLDQVYRSTGSHFADKPQATYMLDVQNPGVVEVTMPVEMPDGSIQTLTRNWPKARILIAFALFNPSKEDIEIVSMYTDNYGGSWSNPKQVAVSSGQDQGITVAAIGDTVFYGFRNFETDAMMGVVSSNRGRTIGKPFEVASSVCAYDVPTLPNTEDGTVVASRTNDFPWVSQNGSKFIMVYSEHLLSSDGGCLTVPGERSDSRIMAVVGSANGKNWSDPVPLAPNADHGFQFMPVVDCVLGFCQAAWWDTRRNSARVREFLTGQGDPISLAALHAYETAEIFADFNYAIPGSDLRIQFRGTADMYTTGVDISSGTAVPTDAPPILVSRYRLGILNGEVVEREANPFHLKAYKTNTVSFMSDYSWMTSVKHRFMFDPENPENPAFWEENSGPNPLNPDELPIYWLSWTDARNARGQLYTATIEEPLPYMRTPGPTTVAREDSDTPPPTPVAADDRILRAEAVEDLNTGAQTCVPAGNPGAGEIFVSINNRIKDMDIYGARIEHSTSAWSLNPTKTLGNIQRTYAVVAVNAADFARRFRFEIANQPAGFPDTARASWDQLPFDPTDPAFSVTAPDIEEFEDVGPQSSVTVALFLVSQASINPVTVHVYDNATDELISSIVVNGTIESGPLLNPDGTENNFEIHNPVVYAPDLFNPDLYNPDLYNPDLYNPDLYNPDMYNPDMYNPDLYNPDLYNPDLYNPDLYNPDLYNPDLYNPDLYNTSLTDADDLDNPEIPDPNMAGVPREPDGTVVRLDVNFAVENVGNTLTPYSVDFAIGDPTVLTMIENRLITTQLIAWQDKEITDVQFCEPALISENRVVAAVNDPDLTTLTIPDIANNRVGALTYFIAPLDKMQNTLRFIGPRDNIRVLAEALPNNIISYVFASQAANTGEIDLGINREQIIVDRTPASFNFSTHDTATFEATSSGGAVVPLDLVQATKDTEIVPVNCTPALGSTVGLDIDNSPAGPTRLSCTATSSNDVTATLDMFVSVLDTRAPTINAGSIPTDITAEATGPGGAAVSFALPSATDASNVDTSVDVLCTPATGDTFPFTSPGQTTTVSCIATDDSGNTDSASFNVTIQDTSAPIFDSASLPAPTAEATGIDGAIVAYSLPTATDVADVAPVVSCDPASGSVFALGTSDVTCTATDASGNSATSTFQVTIEDTTMPMFVIDPLPDVTIEVTGPGGTSVNYPLPASTDISDASPLVSCDPPAGSLFPLGASDVTCTATDLSGNSVTRLFQVIVQDTAPPVITLIGPDSVTVEAGEAYVEQGAGVIDIADAAPLLMIDDSQVDTGTVGTYTVFYNAVDATGNPALQVTRTVVVVDTTDPVIDGLDPPIFDSTEPFVLADDKMSFQLRWGPFGATDADPSLEVDCNVGTLDTTKPLYTFVYDFPVGSTTVTCTATDSLGNFDTASFIVEILDQTAPVLTLNGDPVITIDMHSGPYVDPGATAVDNADGDVSADIVIDSSGVDTTTDGTYTVFISVTDSSGNVAQLTRTVVVEFKYADITGIIPAKTNIKLGSSDPLTWAWLNSNGDPVDVSGDRQLLRIINCSSGAVVLDTAGDPGSSGFRLKSDNWMEFNWQAEGPGIVAGERYCASVRSSRTAQMQTSPPIRVR